MLNSSDIQRIVQIVNSIVTAGTAGQSSIQFKDEGTNLGSTGTATSINFVGPLAVATRATNAITVTTPTLAALASSMNLESGTGTPAAVGVTNVAAITPYSAQYIRVGTVVTVSGIVDVTATAGATLTTFTLAIPIASNFAGFSQLAGAVTAYGTQGLINANVAGDIAEVNYTSVDNLIHSFGYTYTYRII